MTPALVAADQPDIITQLKAIEDEFPEWHCWRSNRGWLWATRRGRNAQSTRDDPRPMTVDGADIARLREQIRQYRVFANDDNARL